jgi:hypothetical protein
MKKLARATHNRHRNGLPERAGQPWTAKEDAQLRAEHADGLALAAIADAHLRTEIGVFTRLTALGLIEKASV